MANEEQLRILNKGVKAWNKWREDNPDVEIDLSGANLFRANLSDASLSDANLFRANLNGADLRFAFLRTANLSATNLRGADLIGANLRGANLSDANLNGTQALATNFSSATLTGVCIKDWNINSETNFENVICDYIYLKSIFSLFNAKKYDFLERRPSDPNRNFAPGEFAKLVEQSIDTVDLIFNKGIDWRAFLSSFQDLRVEYGEQDVSIHAIEKKSDGAFVIRLSVPPEADKGEIESRAKESYETNLKVLEAQYRAELKGLEAHHKDEIISLRKEHNTQILELAKLAASRPITVEAKAVAEHQSKNVEVEMNFQAPVTGAAGKVAGDMNVYASEQKQTLAEAAAEIQKLLQQLEQTNPSATPEQQQAYVDAAISPTLKQRCVGALKAGGETAIEEFLDNPYVNVGKAVVKGWMKPE